MPLAQLRLQKRLVGVLAIWEVRSTEFGRTLISANLLSPEKEAVLPMRP